MVKSGVASVPFISGEKYQYNASTGELWEKVKPPLGFLDLLMQEVKRYVSWWNKNFYLLNTAAGYKVSGTPSRAVSSTDLQILGRNPR